MKLPNCDNAIVPIEKLKEYCLNFNHPRGKHKARVFKEEIGFDETDAKNLQKIIMEGIKSANASETITDEYGVRYIADINYSFKEKNVLIKTIWIVKVGEEIPRLITCYIKK